QAYHCSLARAGIRFRGDPTVTIVNLRRRSSMWTANQAKCHEAHYHVMRKALVSPGGDRHKEAIGTQLWHVVAGAGSQLDWGTADAAAALAMRIAGPSVAPSGRAFQVPCHFSPPLPLPLPHAPIRP